MNHMIGFAIALVCMLIAVFAYMLVIARKLQDVLDELDVIRFGVKDVISEANKIVHDDISNLNGILDKLLEIEKDFDSNISKSTSELVDVCKNHLCAIGDRCKGTEQMVANCTASIAGTAEAVRSLRESTDTLEEQVTAITDYIRDQTVGTVLTVERDRFLDPEPLCDSCEYDDDGIFCREMDPQTCDYYEPKNAFEQAGDV